MVFCFYFDVMDVQVFVVGQMDLFVLFVVGNCYLSFFCINYLLLCLFIMNKVLGIDVGGFGIKGVLVDFEVGDFVELRFCIFILKKLFFENIVIVLCEIVDNFVFIIGDGLVGIFFFVLVCYGVIFFIVNFDQGWVGLYVEKYISDVFGCLVIVFNDVDVVGVGEVYYGVVRGVFGVVVFIILGIGIGFVVINNGILLLNIEFGYFEIDGYDVEKCVVFLVKDCKYMFYKDWVIKCLQCYYEVVEMFFFFDFFVVGGGIFKDYKKFFKYFKFEMLMVFVQLLN